MTTANPHAAEIWLFLALLLVLSGGFYAFVFLEPSAPSRWLSYSAAFMWCPGLAALLTLLILRRSLRGLGWSWGGLRYYLIAYALPLAFCLPVYLVVWWLGLGAFDAGAFEAYAFEALTKHSDVTSYFTYEYGLGFALVVPLLSLPLWKAGQRLARAPFASAPASVSY